MVSRSGGTSGSGLLVLNFNTHPLRRYITGAAGLMQEYWYIFDEPVGHRVRDVRLAIDIQAIDSTAPTMGFELFHGPERGTWLPAPVLTVVPNATGIFDGTTNVTANGPLYAWLAVRFRVSHASQQVGCLARGFADGKPF